MKKQLGSTKQSGVKTNKTQDDGKLLDTAFAQDRVSSFKNT